MSQRKYKIIISGGGTGGHIFPALSIANALKRRVDADILFVGAKNRMEMEKVPAAGYRIEGLDVAGFNRKNLFKNFAVLVRLYKSLRKAHHIVKTFRPDIAIGVGGYASGPTLKAAQRANIPTLLQEQNSYAGVTNKLLAKKAERICVAYPDMQRFFPADKIVMTGNPVRKEILTSTKTPQEARRSFGLEPDLPTVLVVGGSLGARTLNQALCDKLDLFTNAGVQLIWQTGKNFGDKGIIAAKGKKGIVVTQFITDMAVAYTAASLVVSRAGAGSISEIELLGKPCILVPSPNVAEDHQTKNALALVNNDAALMIADNEAVERLADTILSTVKDSAKLSKMGQNVRKLAMENSDDRIVDHILDIIKNHQSQK